MSVTDIAFCILKRRGKPEHFKELITEVMQVKAINPEKSGRLIAQMHTEINLDSRFVHQGSGEWGLREWQPKANKLVKGRSEGVAGAAKRSPSLRDEEEESEAEEDEYQSDESQDEFAESDDEYADEEDEEE